MNLKVLCCVFVVYVCVLAVQSEKVSVTVYYESLCPDSKKFFTSQLYPALQTNLSNWVNLTLVPYGKSNQTKIDEDQYQFTCHHGPYECQGNKIQACALKEIELLWPTPANSGFNPITVAFINCLMDKTEKAADMSYTFPIRNCSEINHVPSYVTIENCANHPTGLKYLAELGEETNNFQANLASVPTIVFDNKFVADDSKDAQNNFDKVLCKYITHDKPIECSSAIAHTISTLTLILLFIKQLF